METSAQPAGGCSRLLGYGLGGAVIIGFICFLIGFVGPIIVTPEANQGPLLGIFITGPIGAVLGFIVGVVYAKLRRPKN